MAHETIRHSCGHEERINLIGAADRRERDRAYEQSRSCRECYIAEQNASAVARSADLPALTGTERQVAYAMTVRIKVLDAIEAKITEIEREHGGSRDQLGSPVTLGRAQKLARRQANAAWWLNNKDETPIRILGSLAKLLAEKDAKTAAAAQQ